MDVQELRAAERFTAIPALTATFAGYTIHIVDLSTIGAQIEHAGPIRLGAVGRFVIRHGDVTIDVQGLLIWSRLSTMPSMNGQHVYRSGVRVEGGNVHYALALHTLIKSGAMKREPDTLARKRQRTLERMAEKTHPGMRYILQPDAPEVSPDQVLLVHHARERLLANPDEAQKWYQRAKYAITHGASNVEIEAINHREEVLAVWEYLERSIDIPTIARAFDKVKSS